MGSGSAQTARTARELTIDELAQAVGMTARNIRAHQSRGLLPAPEVRGRTGYYSAEHIERLRLIRTMQDEGFNLEAIRRLLGADGATDGDGPGERFGALIVHAFEPEEPLVLSAEELAEELGPLELGELPGERADGLVRALGGDRYEISSPTLLRGGRALVELGVDPERALAIGATLREHAAAIAVAFVDVFARDVLGAPGEGESAEQRWQRASAAFERISPLATQALLAAFRIEISQAIAAELEQHPAR